MKIYNTMSKSKEEFKPIEEGKVRMYVCGPTVYNVIHIGNARPMIVFDTVRRYFEYKGYDVNYVQNFTDVDDKIIKRAIEEGIDSHEISQRYIKECQADMQALNVKEATSHPLATQEIDGMIEMISDLIDKGYAYNADGTVYYRTRKFEGYGKLSKKNIDDLEAGHRSIQVAGEESKEDPLDFVLWKPKKEGEPAWQSPWGEGRPGWHIECSVMSKKYLGDEIDIHAGGEDLIFPHHENEIAQSEAANGKTFAKYWMHNGFLNIDNKKMSKSLGNFFTVKDIAQKYDLQVLRFFMLSAHYRSPLNFSADLMEAAKNGLDRILTALEQLKKNLEISKDRENQRNLQAGAQSDTIKNGAQEESMTGQETEALEELRRLGEKFEKAMDDDFNTADGIAAVFEMIKLANIHAAQGSTSVFLQEVWNQITTFCEILGIETERKEEVLSQEIEELIELRQQARKEKNFAKADEIRNQLLDMGIELKDTREGVQWKRI